MANTDRRIHECVCDLGQEAVVQIQKLYWHYHISTQMARPENGLPDRREHCSIVCAWQTSKRGSTGREEHRAEYRNTYSTQYHTWYNEGEQFGREESQEEPEV